MSTWSCLLLLSAPGRTVATVLTKVTVKVFCGFRATAAAILLVLALPGTLPAASASEIVIFAAASLKEALDEATRVYAAQTGDTAKISYAASSALAKQIESGAPADMFISADLDWMDYLQQRNLVQLATRKSFLGNRLVIVAPADTAMKLDIKPGFELAGALKGGHLAMADPDSVPAGKYGKAALEKLGVWNSVKGAGARPVDMWTIRCADRLRFPQVPLKEGNLGKCSPSPTSPLRQEKSWKGEWNVT